MTSASPTPDLISSLAGGGDDMARRRLQQQGNLYRQGKFWTLRWREDVRDLDGKLKRQWSKPVQVGFATGDQAITKKEARRRAWSDWLSKLDQNNHTPKSTATLTEFVNRKFRPEHIQLALKPTTASMYESLLRCHVLPAIGSMQLRDVTRDDVQRLCSSLIGKKSPQTIYHVRNLISAIFNLAEDCEWSSGNPTRRVRLPELVYERRRALSGAEVDKIASLIGEPYSAMVVILARTGMRIGELIGLKWKWVNLSNQHVTVESETIPPYSIAIRESFTAGKWSTYKTPAGRREIPMTSRVWMELMQIWEKYNANDTLLETLEKNSDLDSQTLSANTGNNRRVPVSERCADNVQVEHTVFVNRRSKPLDAHNISNRHFKRAAIAAKIPWATLHCLRHTTATNADREDMTMADRMKLLGHTSPKMTMRYTAADLERTRAILEQTEERGRVN